MGCLFSYGRNDIYVVDDECLCNNGKVICKGNRPGTCCGFICDKQLYDSSYRSNIHYDDDTLIHNGKL